ncbi:MULTISPECIES: IreB family regulatory phosphoprotein [unclassified Granulicatella]|uniref:IreB family regulatory phosphoprotein n=1 Tax=unclassified Granulicatella TaxID=2630493 RepID=UPI00107458B0|nr:MULTISPECIES: IreB family regulatory phosphoprotein [unclassified Granulicatella]MBF0780183.1 IreB family regulatory phosphoprotein [Granulicatella sp. 19428wC4_WM01]TFU95734.1 IreB family regulatory phosphoprotein [Granulicatella sp. WM01]
MEFIDETMLFNKDDFSNHNIHNMLLEVFDALSEKGYHPINQIVGYLMSGDPAYIPRHNEARNRIRQFDRDEILEELLITYLKKYGRMN